MDRIIEICANSSFSCIEAEAGGAARVELCAAIPEGGTTPSIGEVRRALERTSVIKIHVIIRPRGGDFLYSEDEASAMLYDIEAMKSIKVQGFALGCLTKDGNIDLRLLKRLVEAARPLSVTFHRAFDLCRDPLRAMEEIIDCGCDRILTSGQASDALQGIPLLKDLVKRAGDRIIIMPGCGIRSHNISLIERETGAKEFHTSARISIPSLMEYRKEGVPMGSSHIPEFDREVSVRTEVSKFITR